MDIPKNCREPICSESERRCAHLELIRTNRRANSDRCGEKAAIRPAHLLFLKPRAHGAQHHSCNTCYCTSLHPMTTQTQKAASSLATYALSHQIVLFMVKRDDVAMSSGRHFFPKADASVLSRKLAPPPDYPKSVGPVYDCKNVDTPVLPWDSTQGDACYPPQKENYAPAIIPKSGLCLSDRYLRASLARNERLRLSMLWYYTCDIFKETEFLSGLQEKVCIAQESAAWEYAIIGILDVHAWQQSECRL